MTAFKSWVILGIFIIAAASHAEYKSAGNEIFSVLKGPAGELYGVTAGLLFHGSENAVSNPWQLAENGSNDLYLSHSVWFQNNLAASVGAYTYHGAVPIGFWAGRIAVENIADSRNSLLDYGADGIPGTLDAGENNGMLDEGERLNYDNITFKGLSNYAAVLSIPWKHIAGHDLGIVVKAVYEDLIAAKGYGLSFDLTAVYHHGHFNAIHRFQNLPSAVTVFNNGKSEWYSPVWQSGWTYRLDWRTLSFTPYIHISVYPGDNWPKSSVHNEWGTIDFQPGIQLGYKKSITLAVSQNYYRPLILGTVIHLKSFDLQYTYLQSASLLGDSHLFAFAFSLSDFLADEQ